MFRLRFQQGFNKVAFPPVSSQVLPQFSASTNSRPTMELALGDNALLEGTEAILTTVLCSSVLRQRGGKNNIWDLLL